MSAVGKVSRLAMTNPPTQDRMAQRLAHAPASHVLAIFVLPARAQIGASRSGSSSPWPPEGPATCSSDCLPSTCASPSTYLLGSKIAQAPCGLQLDGRMVVTIKNRRSVAFQVTGERGVSTGASN